MTKTNNRTIKVKVKNYFTDKPTSDFWMYAFVTLFIFQYMMPMTLIISVPLQIGLLEPSAEIDYQIIASKVTDKLISPMETLHEVGRNIANNNPPFVTKALFYSIGHLVWIYYIAMLFLLINFARYLISWIYRKLEANKK